MVMDQSRLCDCSVFKDLQMFILTTFGVSIVYIVLL